MAGGEYADQERDRLRELVTAALTLILYEVPLPVGHQLFGGRRGFVKQSRRQIADYSARWSGLLLAPYRMGGLMFTDAGLDAAFDRGHALRLCSSTTDLTARSRLQGGADPGLVHAADPTVLLGMALAVGDAGELTSYLDEHIRYGTDLTEVRGLSTTLLSETAVATGIAAGDEAAAFAEWWEMAFVLGIAEALIWFLHQEEPLGSAPDIGVGEADSRVGEDQFDVEAFVQSPPAQAAEIVRGALVLAFNTHVSDARADEAVALRVAQRVVSTPEGRRAYAANPMETFLEFVREQANQG